MSKAEIKLCMWRMHVFGRIDRIIDVPRKYFIFSFDIGSTKFGWVAQYGKIEVLIFSFVRGCVVRMSFGPNRMVAIVTLRIAHKNSKGTIGTPNAVRSKTEIKNVCIKSLNNITYIVIAHRNGNKLQLQRYLDEIQREIIHIPAPTNIDPSKSHRVGTLFFAASLSFSVHK